MKMKMKMKNEDEYFFFNNRFISLLRWSQ